MFFANRGDFNWLEIIVIRIGFTIYTGVLTEVAYNEIVGFVIAIYENLPSAYYIFDGIEAIKDARVLYLVILTTFALYLTIGIYEQNPLYGIYYFR